MTNRELHWSFYERVENYGKRGQYGKEIVMVSAMQPELRAYLPIGPDNPVNLFSNRTLVDTQGQKLLSLICGRPSFTAREGGGVVLLRILSLGRISVPQVWSDSSSGQG